MNVVTILKAALSLVINILRVASIFTLSIVGHVVIMFLIAYACNVFRARTWRCNCKYPTEYARVLVFLGIFTLQYSINATIAQESTYWMILVESIQYAWLCILCVAVYLVIFCPCIVFLVLLILGSIVAVFYYIRKLVRYIQSCRDRQTEDYPDDAELEENHWYDEHLRHHIKLHDGPRDGLHEFEETL